MTCEIVKTQLSAFIGGTLPEDEMREIYRHLEDCGFCDELYGGLRAASGGLGAATEKDLPEDYRDALRERMLTMARSQRL